MDFKHAIEVLEALASACDPRTGEELPHDHILRRPDIAEVLTAVADAAQAIGTDDSASPLIRSRDSGGAQADSELTAYEAAQQRFGVTARGGPKRFNSPGWFYVDSPPSACPECSRQMRAFRRPYRTKSGQLYHYRALLCLSCERFFEPRELGNAKKSLYENSKHRPSSLPALKPAGDPVSTRLCVSCGKRIPEARIAASPNATRCVVCQRVAESGEADIEDLGVCPRCDSPLVWREGALPGETMKFFLGCSSYPKCRYTRSK